MTLKLEDTRVETANKRYSFILINIIKNIKLTFIYHHRTKLQDKKKNRSELLTELVSRKKKSESVEALASALKTLNEMC